MNLFYQRHTRTRRFKPTSLLYRFPPFFSLRRKGRWRWCSPEMQSLPPPFKHPNEIHTLARIDGDKSGRSARRWLAFRGQLIKLLRHWINASDKHRVSMHNFHSDDMYLPFRWSADNPTLRRRIRERLHKGRRRSLLLIDKPRKDCSLIYGDGAVVELLCCWWGYPCCLNSQSTSRVAFTFFPGLAFFYVHEF